jgi:hypothetical protein
MGKEVLMGEGRFKSIAKAIAKMALENKGISEKDLLNSLPEIIPNVYTQAGEVQINCYPGEPGKCHQFAMFVSLNGKLSKGGWRYSFRGILKVLVQHLQGSCRGKTIEAVLITDTWERSIYEEWEHNLEAIKEAGVYLEIYLIGVTTSGKEWDTEIPC